MDLKKDNIDRLFDRLQDQFDIEEPISGHEERFFGKLSSENQTSLKTKRHNWWRPLSVAASLLLIIGLGFGIFQNNLSRKEVPQEVEKAQFYFASLIENEMEKINAEVTPETQKLVNDAMLQINKLDNDYKKLEEDLTQNGDTKQILNAMITNFQTRINLLEDVLNKIEEVKQLKNINDENHVI